MITDLIINILMAIPYFLLNGLESLNFNLELPNNFFTILNEFSSGVGYVLPVSKLLPIFFITISLYCFRIYWSLVIRIKSFIPGMGS